MIVISRVLPVKYPGVRQSVRLVVHMRLGKNMLWILLLIVALVVGVVMIDVLVIIVGTIIYYVEDFLGLPVPPPPWVD